jgi:DNA modification methylase
MQPLERINMSNVTLLQGDCLAVLKGLPNQSIQCCVTSPPYYGLRDYGTAKWEGGDMNCDHKKGEPKWRSRDKSTIAYAESQGHNLESWGKICGKCGAIRIDDQIGLEETPEIYINKLVAVFSEVKRVLKDDGTLWVNMGDSYATNGTYIGDYKEKHPEHKDFHVKNSERYADKRKGVRGNGIKGKDLLGIPWMLAFALRADVWWLRSDIIWAKPNPMPESVTDRPTKSHEYIFLLAKSQHYYCDMEAIAEPISSSQKEVDRQYLNGTKDTVWATNKNYSGGVGYNSSGKRNKRDVWTVTTKPYKGAHFATFPPDLIEPCILAGSKAGDTVLDPFNGSGTTGAVAIKHNRDYIGIELNPAYIKLTEERLKQVQSAPIP